jgi:acyl carrier protein
MSQTRDERKENLLSFLRTIQKAGLPIESLGERERLVASGLIDSLAILQIVTYLESTYEIDFALRGIDPEQIGSISGILDLIEQEKNE